MEKIKASARIPYLYRFLLTNVEPFLAFNGAIMVMTNPLKYAGTMSRHSISNLDASTNFIYTELAGGWLHFAFTEAVVLRLVDNLQVWRLICMGMLLSDIAYCHSCAQALGGWDQWLIVANWTMEDWVVTITTWPFVIARIAIVLGIGLGNPAGEEERKKVA